MIKSWLLNFRKIGLVINPKYEIVIILDALSLKEHRSLYNILFRLYLSFYIYAKHNARI